MAVAVLALVALVCLIRPLAAMAALVVAVVAITEVHQITQAAAVQAAKAIAVARLHQACRQPMAQVAVAVLPLLAAMEHLLLLGEAVPALHRQSPG